MAKYLSYVLRAAGEVSIENLVRAYYHNPPPADRNLFIFFDIGEYANIPKRKNSHILALDILTMAKMRMGFTNATRGIETGFLMETDNLQHLYWRLE